MESYAWRTQWRHMDGWGAADASGNIYLQTGNGDLVPGSQRFGDSLVKLRFQNNAISVSGFFAPCNQMLLDRCDLDQGSSGAVLFDEFVIGGGKDGRLYLMKADKMPGYMPGPFPPPADACMPAQPDCTDSSDLVQKWQASGGHIHGAPIIWKGPNNQTWLYVMGEGDPLKAFPFEQGRFHVEATTWTQPKLNQVRECQTVPNHGIWMPGGLLSVSSNGSAAGSGIVWALVPANGDGNSCRGVKGMLMAFNAEDISKEIWRSQAKDINFPTRGTASVCWHALIRRRLQTARCSWEPQEMPSHFDDTQALARRKDQPITTWRFMDSSKTHLL